MAGMMEGVVEHNELPVGKAESILAAAKRTFLASGFGAVSMDAIAREAGVSKATVYAHFAGKEELFGAVIGRECGLYFARFSAGELDPVNVRASLTVLGRRYLELVLSPEAIALHRIILGEVTRFLARRTRAAAPADRGLSTERGRFRHLACPGRAHRCRAIRVARARRDSPAPGAAPRSRGRPG